jgi:hypothetical protein
MLNLTGRRTLIHIERAVPQWADEMGAAVGEPTLRAAHSALARVLEATEPAS